MTAAKKPKSTLAKAVVPPTPLWAWMQKGDGETYQTFKSYDAALKNAKDTIKENYHYNNSDSKPPVIQIFQQVQEVQLAVKVEEIPVTKFQVTLL